jgi:hypothetical protein
MRGLITVELAVAAAGLVTFVAMYARVGWRGTPEGRHVMFFSGALGLLLVMWLIGRLTGGLPLWLWAVALAALPVAAWWRVILFWRRQHETKSEVLS